MRLLTIAALAFGAAPAAAQQVKPVAPEPMRRVAPALADYTDRLLFGDVWKRPGLTSRDRSLVTITILIATGKSAPLSGHLGRALDNGVTPAEIGGTITHLAFYAGWPNAVSATEVADAVFTKRRIPTSARQPARTARLPVPGNDGERAATVERTVTAVSPSLAQLTNEPLFGDLWLRSDLSPRDRSLVTIVALTLLADGWRSRALSVFPITNPARERKATATSALPPLQAVFPKTVPKTISRQGVISTELWE